MRIGVTGSEGLVGSALCKILASTGFEVRRFDRRCRPEIGAADDVRDLNAVRRFVAECDGVVHLAAVSRVVWGERDPDLCIQTNVEGTRNVVRAALDARARPWIILASSREVYGEPETVPVAEVAPLRPVNVYGRSKVDAEALVLDGREHGLRTAVLRLSNVYGSIDDHEDRVVPAFARAAAESRELRVDGAEHTFDFTHVDDTTRGIVATIDVLASGERSLPPVHLVTGRATTLGQLAAWAVAAGEGTCRIRESAARSYDVARFVGDPSNAQSLLGWRAKRSVEEGVRDLVAGFQRLRVTSSNSTAVRGVA